MQFDSADNYHDSMTGPAIKELGLNPRGVDCGDLISEFWLTRGFAIEHVSPSNGNTASGLPPDGDAPGTQCRFKDRGPVSLFSEHLIPLC